MKDKTIYQYSLIILLIFGLIDMYYKPANGSLFKLVINSHIYVSLLLIPYASSKLLKFHFGDKVIALFYLLMIYAFFSIVRDLFKGEVTSLLGNPFYGPSFLVPIFLLWGTRLNSLYWLHQTSMIAIKIGIFLAPVSFYFKTELPIIAFFPTFFLVLNYKYAPKKDRIWIVLGMVIGLIVFSVTYRSGIIRLVMSLAIFVLFQINLRKIYKYAVLALFAIPIFGIYIGLIKGQSIFAEVSVLGLESETNLAQDTRTLLYTEVFSDLKNTNSFLFGKGPLGTYSSDYFYNYEGDDGDYYIRHLVEVGVLQYLLKGGVVYILLLFMIIIYAISNVLRKSRNRYVKSLAVLLASFLMISFIENIPRYSMYFASVWIIVGICLSKRFSKVSDYDIKRLMRNNTRTIIMKGTKETPHIIT